MLVWMFVAAALTGGGVALTLSRTSHRRRPLTARVRAAYRRRLHSLRRGIYRRLDWHLGTRTVATARRTRGGRVQVRTYTRAGQPVRAHRRTR